MERGEDEHSEPVNRGRSAALVGVSLLVLLIVVWLQLGGGLAAVKQALSPDGRSPQPQPGTGLGTAPLSSPGPRLRGVSPAPRIGAAIAPQIVGNLPGAILFGGRTDFRGEKCTPDMWRWADTLGWSRVMGLPDLPCLDPHLAFDSAAAPGPQTQQDATQFVLVASRCGGCPLETWTSTSGVSSWTRYLGTAPPARRDYTVAADLLNSDVVLFGGRSGSNGPVLADTWTWDRQQWTERHPAHSPPPREGAGSASTYSTTTGVVLFGGFHDQTELDDTWEWTGQDWIQRHPTHSPSAREWPSMAFGLSVGGTVLFGGFSSGTYLEDAWSWDGADWAQLTLKHHPGPRESAALGADSQGDLLLFGGDVSASPAHDTWTFDGRDWIWELP